MFSASRALRQGSKSFDCGGWMPFESTVSTAYLLTIASVVSAGLFGNPLSRLLSPLSLTSKLEAPNSSRLSFALQ